MIIYQLSIWLAMLVNEYKPEFQFKNVERRNFLTMFIFVDPTLFCAELDITRMDIINSSLLQIVTKKVL